MEKLKTHVQIEIEEAVAAYKQRLKEKVRAERKEIVDVFPAILSTEGKDRAQQKVNYLGEFLTLIDQTN